MSVPNTIKDSLSLNQARIELNSVYLYIDIIYSAVKSIAWPFKSTLLYAQMNHIAIAGGDGPSGSAEGRIPNPFLKKNALIRARVWRLASDRPYIVGVSGAKITVRRAVFSSDLAFMSKNEPWLLVFMALGANLKISIFDPPGVRPAYLKINLYELASPRKAFYLATFVSI